MPVKDRSQRYVCIRMSFSDDEYNQFLSVHRTRLFAEYHAALAWPAYVLATPAANALCIVLKYRVPNDETTFDSAITEFAPYFPNDSLLSNRKAIERAVQALIIEAKAERTKGVAMSKSVPA